jgi:prepilin-type N-terminal cleavage/methylation domain-containing protein
MPSILPLHPPRYRCAFTLIELLIVVAIIAILAAIAVPNLLEAQVRSKVARVKTDHRTLAIALDSYFVDNQSYPRDHDNLTPEDADRWSWGPAGNQVGFYYVTTPIAYISSLTRDPFATSKGMLSQSVKYVAPFYHLASGSDNPIYGMNRVHAYLFVSLGADNRDNTQRQDYWPSEGQEVGMGQYDPTNGTRSDGDIYRFGGDYRRGDWEIWEIPWDQWDPGITMP